MLDVIASDGPCDCGAPDRYVATGSMLHNQECVILRPLHHWDQVQVYRNPVFPRERVLRARDGNSPTPHDDRT